jgi:hypothetical protein
MYSNYIGLDSSLLPELYKLLKDRENPKEKHDHTHEKKKHDHHEAYQREHREHPNEKPCGCHEHDHKRCHHGYEQPYHDHRDYHSGGHHHHHDCGCGHHHHHNDCGCGHHHHDCGHHHHHNHCRRFLCDDDFRLRLGGLLNNLNFKLRQLIGCMVELELDDSRKLEAEICFVGTNFVEVKNYGEVFEPEPEPGEEEPESPDIPEQPDAAADENEDVDEPEKHCYSWIIPMEKIKYVQVYHGEKC